MSSRTLQILFFILFFLKCHFHYGQFFSNPSFEGTAQTNVPPAGWEPCNQYSTPDTQPGSFEVITKASQGNTFLGLVTRGNLGPYANFNEAAQTKLLKPFIKDKAYSLKLDLCHSKELGHFIGFSDEFLRYDTPAKLRLWGGTSSCNKAQVLWESPTIDHAAWKTYAFELKPNADVNYLIFEAIHVSQSTYFGNVLIDNLVVDLCSIAPPITTQSFDSLFCKGDSLIIDAFSMGANYRWDTGSTNPAITVSIGGSYKVEISNGCEADTKVFEYVITAKDCYTCEVSLPNVFTPNGDEKNDLFEITGTDDIARFNLQVYNRWGKLVYQTDQMDNFWTGSEDGKESAEGIYFWTINLQCIAGRKIKDNFYKGWVNVLK
jgi:gliding motility-associated-like protein